MLGGKKHEYARTKRYDSCYERVPKLCFKRRSIGL